MELKGQKYRKACRPYPRPLILNGIESLDELYCAEFRNTRLILNGIESKKYELCTDTFYVILLILNGIERRLNRQKAKTAKRQVNPQWNWKILHTNSRQIGNDLSLILNGIESKIRRLMISPLCLLG